MGHIAIMKKNMEKQKQNKTYYELERIMNGVANHRWIEILEILGKKPEMSVTEIADKVKSNFKTTSEHIRKNGDCRLIDEKSRQ